MGEVAGLRVQQEEERKRMACPAQKVLGQMTEHLQAEHTFLIMLATKRLQAEHTFLIMLATCSCVYIAWKAQV